MITEEKLHLLRQIVPGCILGYDYHSTVTYGKVVEVIHTQSVLPENFEFFVKVKQCDEKGVEYPITCPEKWDLINDSGWFLHKRAKG